MRPVGVVDHAGVVRCTGGKVQAVDAQHFAAHPVVEDDPHQFGKRGGAVSRAANGGGQ